MALGTLSRDSSQLDARSMEGVRSKTPPGTPKKCGKLAGVRVMMLDDSVTLFQVQVGGESRENISGLSWHQIVKFFTHLLWCCEVLKVNMRTCFVSVCPNHVNIMSWHLPPVLCSSNIICFSLDHIPSSGVDLSICDKLQKCAVSPVLCPLHSPLFLLYFLFSFLCILCLFNLRDGVPGQRMTLEEL